MFARPPRPPDLKPPRGLAGPITPGRSSHRAAWSVAECRGFVDRQPEPDPGAAVWRVEDRDLALMCVDDALDDEQPETAAPAFAGPPEPGEDARTELVRDAGATIVDLDHHPVTTVNGTAYGHR